MRQIVGPKGQVVIEKEIRDRLGVQPGWQALQLLAGDHVKIYFFPPPYRRSLAGCLGPYIETQMADDGDEAWDEAVGRAIAMEFAAELAENGGEA